MSRHLIDDEAIDKLAGRAKVLARQDLEDFRSVVSTPQGRRFVKHTACVRGGLISNEFAGNSRDAFNNGRRDVGDGLIKDFQAVAPEQWALMEAEYVKAYLDELKFQRSERDAKRKEQEDL